MQLLGIREADGEAALCEGVHVHAWSSEEQSVRKHGMQRDPCSPPPSAILIPTSEPAASVGFFTTTKAEVTTGFFLLSASEEPELFWDLSVLH